MPTIRSKTSPNKTKRPNGRRDVQGGLIHWTATKARVSAMDIARYFANAAAQVSAHCVVDRNGDRVRCVPLGYAAWHAGRSRYDFNRDGEITADEHRVNTRTVGWELCHYPGEDWPDAQIRALAKEIRRTRRLCPEFKLRLMTDHEAVSLSGKWDVDKTFPAARLFWYVIHPRKAVPKNVYDALPKWARKQVDEIKR